MNISILGFGFMGKKHKTVLDQISNISINAIIDSHQTDFLGFQTLEDFLQTKPESDLVVIATPNYLHFAHAKTLLENGYHVLIEKPFAFNTDQAKTLQEIADANGKKAFLVMQNRFSSVTKFLSELIANETLGRIYNIQFNAFWNRGESYYVKDSWKGGKNTDGGILYTQFSHLIDLLCHVFDDDFEVLFKDLSSYRNFTISEIEDTAILILQNKSGMKASVNFTTAVFEKNQETSLNIIAENGTLKISGQYFNEISFQHVKDYPENFKIISTSNEENLTEMYLEIFKSIENQKNQAILLQDGVALVKLLEDIYSPEN